MLSRYPIIPFVITTIIYDTPFSKNLTCGEICVHEVLDGVDDDGGEGAKGGEGTTAKHGRGG